MTTRQLVSMAQVERAIVIVRGQRVLLDVDLAVLYGVAVKALKQAVRRNIERFPADFLFQLTPEEARRSRSQTVTLNADVPETTDLFSQRDLNRARGKNIKYEPYAFTEQGVAMLSSVLRSPRAARVNIEIMRAFIRLRQLLRANADLAIKLAALERKYDRQFRVVFDAIRELMAPVEDERRPIGFRKDSD